MDAPLGKPKTKKAKPKQPKLPSDPNDPTWLKLPTDRRKETRFLPLSNLPAISGVLASSVGCVLAGAGAYGQLLRKVGPHPYALPLLIGGLALFLLGLFISSKASPNLRVGDAGVAVETSKGLDRLAWHEIDGVGLSGDTLSFRGQGKIVSISKAGQPLAFNRALSEGRSRIPAKLAQINAQAAAVAKEAARGREIDVVLPILQLAGLHCHASERLIAFETDARICGRCSQTYHRKTAPPRCVTCDARLK